MLTFAHTPTNEAALFIKRVIDVVVSATALLVLSPLLLLTALTIRLESAGPALFSQERIGKMGRRFRLLKFRSMVSNADEQRDALRAHNEMDGPMFKMRRDPRVTRVGRLIRKTSIDELPQLINVLRGEMSLVGPRPSLPEEVRQFKPWQRRRLSMKPGITCIWQVSGRNKVDFERWMELDLEYIDHWSLWLDLKILAKTVPVVVFGIGAS
jgi:exopolysaccharide biosynthesis polyprenyl glycosylphosphotransferase